MDYKNVEHILNHIDQKNDNASNTGFRSVATNTRRYSAANNTGDYSVAINTGDYSAATNTGEYSVATNTGDVSAATNTGDYSVAINTGECSAAAVTGKESIAIATGGESRAKGYAGCWLVLAEWEKNDNSDWYIKEVKSILVDGDTVKPDTFYTLKNGEVVQVSE
jgi:hypothetical protein